MEFVIQQLSPYVSSLPWVLLALLMAFVVKKIDDVRTSNLDDDAAVNDSNLAVGIRRAGLYLGLLIAYAGMLKGGGTDTAINTMLTIVIIPAGILLAHRINDLAFLAGIDNDAAISKNNVAVGFAEAGSLVATGFVVNGACTGAGGGWLSVLVFFALGQAALFLMFLLYEHALTKFNVTKEIEQGNVAAGVGFASMLVSLGIILRASVAGPFTGWQNDIVSFTLHTAVSMVVLVVATLISNWLFLPNAKVDDQAAAGNTAALTLAGSIVIAMAVVVSSAL